MHSHPRGGLFLQMGFGKTRVVIEHLREVGRPRTLVIAPKKVAELVWPTELARWDPQARVSAVVGTPVKRVRALQADADVFIISCDNLVWFVNDGIKASGMAPFEAIVVDELSKFKANVSQRWRALRSLTLSRKAPPKYVWGLTGTPASEHLMDLWAEMFVIDGGVALGKRKGDYRDQYFVPDNPYKPHPKYILRQPLAGDKDRRSMQKRIFSRLEKSCISMEAEDLKATLPDLFITPVHVPLPQSLLDGPRGYNAFMREAVWGVLGRTTQRKSDGSTVTRPILADWALPTQSMSELRLKALQFTAGFLYRGAEGATRTVEHLHTEKLDMTVSLVEQLQGDPVVIFYRFQEERDRLERALSGTRHINDPQVIDDWNAGRVPVLLANPKSAGHGLNLQHGGCHQIWTSLPDSQQEWSQGIHRLLRPGQSRPVTVQVLITPGTWDTVAWDSLQQKLRTEQQLLTHLQLVTLVT